MKTTSTPVQSTLPRNLHQLVGIAAGNAIPAAVQRNSFIINEVPRQFQIASNEKILASILNNLLTAVVSHTKHSCIRIKAKKYDDVICIFVRDNSIFSNYATDNNLVQLKMLAKKMNGSISIRNMEDKFTTILLRFPDFTKVA